MHRRSFLATAGALATAGLTTLAGCSAPTTAGLANGGFESGLAGWERGRELPTDPNTGAPVASAVTVSDEQASEGSRAASFFIDGRQDDGTLWVAQTTDLSDADTLAVDVWSPEESFNTITKVAAYAGPERPLTESAFDTTRAVEDHGGWRTYEYPVESATDGLVAVGISVVWEAEVRRYVDAVRLR
ncbi:hypothetical protein [Halarchaeum grantii]|uniref:hypothetical protein n=1 Tax=Halarchaeum grantii TaxID=1193105 RepID=UPI00166F1EDA|nr:hypothetical protein [Halarchaeum grantii]